MAANPTFAYSVGGVDTWIDAEGGITETVTDKGAEAKVMFKCAYAQRYALVKALLGYTQAAGRSFVYVPPFAYPASPNLFCNGLYGDITGIKPYRDSFNWWQYEFALVPAKFATVTWQQLEGDPDGQNDPSGLPFTETRFRTSAEVFSPPAGSFYFVGTGKPVTESTVGLVRPRVEIQMKRLNLPFVPLVAMTNLAGTLNAAPITFGDMTFPTGCLLYTGADNDPHVEPSTGLQVQDVTHTLLGNLALDWNQFMDRTGAWRYINTKNDGSGLFPFGYADFSPLFGYSL